MLYFLNAFVDFTSFLRNPRMERINKWTYKGNNGSEREAGHHRYYGAEKTTVVWPRQNDARGQNTKINYGFDTTGEKERRKTKKKKWMEGVQAAMTTRKLEPDQRRNREELRLVSGRRRQLLKNRTDRRDQPILVSLFYETVLNKYCFLASNILCQSRVLFFGGRCHC